VAVAAPALLILLASFATAAADQRPMSDDGISRAIEQEFLRDDIVPFNRVDVVTADGIVTLTGNVTTLAAQRYAGQRASIVRGVRSVINRIDVIPRQRAPEAIAAGVRSALTADPATDEYEVAVDADSAGKVTLTGAVDSHAEKMLVSNVAMTVPGVSAIDNRLDVEEPVTYGAEKELGEQIRGRLRWDVRVNDSLISVLAREGGRITLSGTVGSLAEKSLAEQLAWVDGVRSVEADYLRVEPWARDEDLRRGKYEPKSDQEIVNAVTAAFNHDPRVLGTPIEVTVVDGSAWLRGSVDNLIAKQAAERDALNAVGVERVYNLLKVRPEILTDAAITQLITDGLRGAGLLENNDIEVMVDDRHARLTGDVGSTAAYWQSVHIANRARGLEDLRYDLTIRGQTPMIEAFRYGEQPQLVQRPRTTPEHRRKSDREIHREVASELYWSPFVDADRVTIDVDNGVVTLTGAVGSPRERLVARDNALEGGALAVNNDLTIAHN
jgi:osmotically-inducible protein OsmY